MKHTSLYETHRAAGAITVPFAGWEMPVSYAGTVAEVGGVRTAAGLFDVSHMGEASVTGEGALAFLQRVTTNDVSKLVPGRAQYSLLLNEAGGVVDDILVYCAGPDDYFVVLNAGCKDKDWAWLEAQAAGASGVTLKDLSDETALIAVQGPQAVELVARAADEDRVAELARFTFAAGQIAGVPLLLSRTGYTGEDGFEIFCGWDDAPRLWQALTDWGAAPAGLGARDVLRLEAAYSLYGHELDADTSPFESGVGWAVKMRKGDFVGRAALQGAAPRRQIVGLRMDERAIPREGYAVHDAGEGGRRVGETTSGTWSPTVKAGVALARLESERAAPGARVVVDIRGRRAPATVVPLPFYRNGV
jgi:aminomethyltransferase